MDFETYTPLPSPRPAPPLPPSTPVFAVFCREGKSVAVVSDAGTPVRYLVAVWAVGPSRGTCTPTYPLPAVKIRPRNDAPHANVYSQYPLILVEKNYSWSLMKWFIS